MIRIRHLLCVTAVAAPGFGAVVAIAGTDDVKAAPVETTVSLGDARALAHVALSRGDADLALKLGTSLLQADARDANALAIVAAAEAQRGNHRASRRAAGRAYRASDDDTSRLKAAQFAARAAMLDKRPTLTQIWLRRAATNTTNPEDIKRIGADYARVRAMNPFSFRIGASVSPSDNVNNGADSALQTIDGVPIVGSLSGSAQALSGTVATTDIALGYRIAQSDTGVTEIGTRLYVKRVSLSSEAKAMAPGFSGADLGSTYADVSIDRRFRWGKPGNTASVGLALGKTWSGGDASYDFASLRASRSVGLGARTRLGFSAALEERKSAVRASQDQTLTTFGAQLSHKLTRGDTVGLSFSLSDVDAGHINQRQSSASVRASYHFGQSIGPAQVTASLIVGQSQYDDFSVGWIAVPGGREDTSFYGDVTFFFADYDYAGFAPSVRLRAGQRQSNVSRYEGAEFSVNFEVKSVF
ncbi:hypothetical protein [Pseudosulfitobacter koreensis]|uniref:DUF560 domain-containing protein n=1 Tax=Pseudosulfitobacter koreensis TaxID=2968472 RepID=A0ABT1Z4C6_9RHOB|nr:hypothetical protein [Pseudosulfitobacter koreense]MCR8827986.1 hypothetical protein [Pseudosulfitobacter koreense]